MGAAGRAHTPGGGDRPAGLRLLPAPQRTDVSAGDGRVHHPRRRRLRPRPPARLPGWASGPGWSAAPDPDTGADHRRRSITLCRRSTPSSFTRGCPTASSASSTPGTSPGKTPPTSTLHSLPAGGQAATRPSALRQHRDSVQHLKRTTGHPHHRAPQRGPTADDWPVPLCTGGCECWPC